MTDAELNFAIASYLEPEPLKSKVLLGKDSLWRRRGQWEPRDVINDPEMTVFLLKKLMEHRTEGGHVLFLNDGGFSIDSGTPQRAEEFQRAVAIWFALAHGIWKE